jgi:hypothetical protein
MNQSRWGSCVFSRWLRRSREVRPKGGRRGKCCRRNREEEPCHSRHRVEGLAEKQAWQKENPELGVSKQTEALSQCRRR